MILEYEEKYAEEVKDLLVELQEYIVSIDKDGYNIITEDYREEYFKKTIEEVSKFNGKIFLYEESSKIVGMIAGVVNSEETDIYDYKGPKTGRVTELVVTKSVRSKGIGKKLLNHMEQYLKSIGCKDILIGVFAYNENAKKFYEKNGYGTRMLDVRKNGI